ncbi:MAG TPA: TPM domain-containing protein [Patescibacteria group bacterium]|nr:TPM domain-containing protein [Patescibacteria group bacterium]
MHRVIRPLVALALAAAAAASWLIGPSLAAGPPLPPSQPGVYVYDFAQIWNPDTEARAQAIAEAIRSRTQAQMVAVSWPSGLSSVDPDTAIADARTILDAWGVGRRGVNDGLVVLFDMDTSNAHGQVAMFAGSGFEDLYLNASERERIITGDMLPRAVEGNLDRALLDGLNHVDSSVQPGGNPERTRQRTVTWLVAIVALAGGLFVFGMFVRRWWLSGRDAPVPLIDDSVLLPAPPKGLTPALATALQRNGVDNEAFTSALVDLGHRGLLTFREQDDDAKKVDLMVPPEPLAEIPYLEARRRPLGSAEAALERAISRSASDLPTGWEVLTSERLKAGKGKQLFDEFKADLGRAAKASGWFRDDPNRLPGRWLAIGIGLIVAAGIAAFLFVLDTSDNGDLLLPGREVAAGALGIVAALGIAIIVFSGRLVARTADGSQTLAMSLAYRNTLRRELETAGTVDEAVEHTQTRLPWITTPDLLTVWAVAFGLKDEIDALIRKTFEQAQQAGLHAWSPLWFIGSPGSGGGFSAVSGIGAAVGSISATATSSSGGGFGGGGSGGGGGSSGGF